jgi:hypothetical protein
MTPMNFLKKWRQDHTGLIRLVLFLFVDLNFFFTYRMFSAPLLLALAQIIVAVVLLLAAIFIH